MLCIKQKYVTGFEITIHVHKKLKYIFIAYYVYKPDTQALSRHSDKIAIDK